MIYFKIKKLIYISLFNPFYDMKQLKGVFKPLKRHFRWGKSNYPVLWVPKPALIQICSRSVGWKDKWYTPRFEYDPYIWIHLFGFNLVWFWRWENDILTTDEYWEQALWYLYYNKGFDSNGNPDIEVSRKTWPWQDHKTEESTWNDKFLI